MCSMHKNKPRACTVDPFLQLRKRAASLAREKACINLRCRKSVVHAQYYYLFICLFICLFIYFFFTFGSFTGNSLSGTATGPQVLQWMIGIGAPQNLWLKTKHCISCSIKRSNSSPGFNLTTLCVLLHCHFLLHIHTWRDTSQSRMRNTVTFPPKPASAAYLAIAARAVGTSMPSNAPDPTICPFQDYAIHDLVIVVFF